MKESYLIVDKAILPDYYDKVIEARAMIADGRVKDVSDAVTRVGISRSTYYKYKDYIFAPNSDTLCRKAVISFSLLHEKGLLGEVLAVISETDANILTINQNLPINGSAHVLLSADISMMKISTDEFISRISKCVGVRGAHLIAIE